MKRRDMTTHMKVSYFVLALAMAPALEAREVPRATPESVGLSSERLSRIGMVMQRHVDEGRFPGAVALVARRGKLAYLEHWGDTTPSHLFRIYSMTKPVTSVAVMILHEEGRFLLDDPVSKFLPELAEPEVLVEVDMGSLDEKRWIAEPAAREITIRDLLRHTSGFTYGIFDDTKVDQLYLQANVLDSSKSNAELVRTLGTLPLKHQPGTVWNYSVSTDVLGRLVEVVSGTTLDAFFQHRIFGPLSMVDTGFVVPANERARLAVLYRDGRPASETAFDFTVPRAKLSGGGGLVSTVHDYLRFCLMLSHGGELDGSRIVSRKSVELMTRDHLGDIDSGGLADGYGFGLGFAVAKDLGRMGKLGSEGEYYWGGIAGTSFFIDPAEDMIGVFMVQSWNDYGPRDEFQALAYQAIVD